MTKGGTGGSAESDGNGTAQGIHFEDVNGVGRFGPLRGRQFRLLWLGRTGSAVGDSLIAVALIWAVGHDLHAGATGVGIVLACYTVGGASVTLAGGVWADRLPRRAVMILADLVRVATQSVTAVLLFSGNRARLGARGAASGRRSGRRASSTPLPRHSSHRRWAPPTCNGRTR